MAPREQSQIAPCNTCEVPQSDLSVDLRIDLPLFREPHLILTLPTTPTPTPTRSRRCTDNTLRRRYLAPAPGRDSPQANFLPRTGSGGSAGSEQQPRQGRGSQDWSAKGNREMITMIRNCSHSLPVRDCAAVPTAASRAATPTPAFRRDRSSASSELGKRGNARSVGPGQVNSCNTRSISRSVCFCFLSRA